MADFTDKLATTYNSNYAPSLTEQVNVDSLTVNVDSTDVSMEGWDKTTTYPRPNFTDQER